jgi:hypothetical protein
MSGTYTLRTSTITLNFDGEELTGTISGTTMTLIVDGKNFIFKKQ